MRVLLDNLPSLLEGFGKTLGLSALAALIALVLGTILAACRVSPIPTLRGIGTSYVNVVRNTPLVLLLVLFVFGVPQLGITGDHVFALCVTAIGCYAAAFICEALRSGINSVHPGQAEAARAIGLTFTQNLQLIILPQAFRAVIPPLANVFIALVKNTAIVEAFGVTEAAFQMDSLIRDNPNALIWVFVGAALGYIIIVFAISGVARVFERRLAVAR